MKTASIGSVSTGTLRSEDLIPALHDELESQLFMQDRTAENRETIDQLHAVYGRIQDECWDEAGEFVLPEFDSEIVDELCDALSQFAPPYCYFGAHPGDGADFGYWPSLESLDDSDALRVDDTGDVPADYSGEVIHVNDHGNLTLYVADHGKLTEVFGVV